MILQIIIAKLIIYKEWAKSLLKIIRFEALHRNEDRGIVTDTGVNNKFNLYYK